MPNLRANKNFTQKCEAIMTRKEFRCITFQFSFILVAFYFRSFFWFSITYFARIHRQLCKQMVEFKEFGHVKFVSLVNSWKSTFLFRGINIAQSNQKNQINKNQNERIEEQSEKKIKQKQNENENKQTISSALSLKSREWAPCRVYNCVLGN